MPLSFLYPVFFYRHPPPKKIEVLIAPEVKGRIQRQMQYYEKWLKNYHPPKIDLSPKTASRGSCGAVAACYVRPGGLEPPRPKTLDPKSNAATNYATGANVPQRYDFFLNCRPLCDGVWMLSHTAESAEPNNRLSRQLHIRTAIDVFVLKVLVLQKHCLTSHFVTAQL